MSLPWKAIFGAAGLFAAGRVAVRRWQESRYALIGRVVLITGGSRGLGLTLAREYASRGAKLVLVARDAATLDRARQELEATGASVVALPCDVSDAKDVARTLELAVESFGRLDIVVNDAGQIDVGPLQSMTVGDFEEAMDTNFWGAFNVINAALPYLRPNEGRIVNISSVGGLLSVPHLLPYSASKFALTGFSLGLRVELANKGILVTTVCPGLMRTGSPVNAHFKGDQAAEYAWFSVGDSLPFLSISATRAARAIVRASQRGDVLLVLGAMTKLAVLANGLLPSLVVRASSVAARLLPQAEATLGKRGRDIAQRAPAWLTAPTDKAALANNELGHSGG
jgi:NAD(P)-dependent dehydrogenase (short-subunit alcohol dehydrogenase family)